MHKKSRKRIPQEIKPWRRVNIEDDDLFEILGDEFSVRWTSGSRRNKETSVLNQQSSVEFSKMLLQSFIEDTAKTTLKDVRRTNLMRITLAYKPQKYHHLASIPRSKNTCYFLGKGSTFNRKLLISRHTFRKLTRFGLISGLLQGK